MATENKFVFKYILLLNTVLSLTLSSCTYLVYSDIPQVTHFSEANQLEIEVGAAFVGDHFPVANGQVSYSVTDFLAFRINGSYYKKYEYEEVQFASQYRDTVFNFPETVYHLGISTGYIFPNKQIQIWAGTEIGNSMIAYYPVAWLSARDEYFRYATDYFKIFSQFNYSYRKSATGKKSTGEFDLFFRPEYNSYISSQNLLDGQGEYITTYEGDFFTFQTGFVGKFCYRSFYVYYSASISLPVNIHEKPDIEFYSRLNEGIGLGFYLD